jgi:DNA-binding NarL/FixJ family response regulator
MAAAKTRILLADDHQIILDGLRSFVEKQSDMEVVGEAKDGRAAVRMARELVPAVIVMDISMPELNGIEAARQILAEQPDIKIIALSMHVEQRFVSAMFQVGASGYLSKDNAFNDLVRAIRTVLVGKVYTCSEVAGTMVSSFVQPAAGGEAPQAPGLSPREREVLQLLAEGKSAKAIADLLFISVKTVETHRRNIMEKLELKTVAELTRYAIREGLIEA